MNFPVKYDFAETICITVDVEWANTEVLADMVKLLDERGLRGTFFCTHPGIETSGHEQALHPNFRHKGDSFQRLWRKVGNELFDLADSSVYEFMVQDIHRYYPDARGVRAHSLFFDSELLNIYQKAGMAYDSSYFLPLASGLYPVLKECDIVEIPIYYMDHVDLMSQFSGFSIQGLRLEKPGIRVFDFHPNMVFLNAATEDHYLDAKPYYHDYEKLMKMRFPGRGVRSLFLEFLDFINKKKLQTLTLSEVNDEWRKSHSSEYSLKPFQET